MYHARDYHCASLICYTQPLGLVIQGSYERDVEYDAKSIWIHKLPVMYNLMILGLLLILMVQIIREIKLNSSEVDILSGSLLGFAPPKVTLKRKRKLEDHVRQEITCTPTEILMDVNFWR